tara:strand:+ start:3635 stop:3898 length:264 start_codon:yes stop_codon:yes gene_type:complete
MKTTVEISLYKLQEEDSNGNYKLIVKEFLKSIQNKNLEIETNGLSSLIYGDYSDIIELLNNEVRDFLDKYRSVFVLKISKGTLKYKD